MEEIVRGLGEERGASTLSPDGPPFQHLKVFINVEAL